MSYFRHPISRDLVNAKGDLIIATGDDLVTRHAAGSNGRVPVYDSAQADGVNNRDIAHFSPVILAQGQMLIPGATAATSGKVFGQNGLATNLISVDVDSVIVVPLTSAILDVAGWTTKVRVVGSLIVNNTAPTGNFRIHLYPISTIAGGVGVTSITLGTVVASSNTITAPAAGQSSSFASSWFSVPADGNYVMTCEHTALTATNSQVNITAMVQSQYQ